MRKIVKNHTQSNLSSTGQILGKKKITKLKLGIFYIYMHLAIKKTLFEIFQNT
jgi:hypothetical protein